MILPILSGPGVGGMVIIYPIISIIVTIVFSIILFFLGFAGRKLFEKVGGEKRGLLVLSILLLTFFLIIPFIILITQMNKFLLPFFIPGLLFYVFLEERVFASFFTGGFFLALGYFGTIGFGLLRHKEQLDKKILMQAGLFAIFFLLCLIASLSQSPVILSSIAIEQENVLICEQAIGGQVNLDASVATVADFCKTKYYYKIALKYNDTSYCEKIGTSYMNDFWREREDCYDEIASATGDPTACNDHLCIERLAVEHLDVSMCEEINNPRITKYSPDPFSQCVYRVNVKKGDPNACSEIESPNLVRNCLIKIKQTIYTPLVNQAIREENVELCNNLVDSEAKKCIVDTISGIAANKEDFSVCNQLSENEHSKIICINNVFVRLARDKRDISICEQMTWEISKIGCIDVTTYDIVRDLVIEQGKVDPELCSVIHSTGLLEDCIKMAETGR